MKTSAERLSDYIWERTDGLRDIERVLRELLPRSRRERPKIEAMLRLIAELRGDAYDRP